MGGISIVNRYLHKDFSIMETEIKKHLSKTEIKIIGLLEKGLPNKSISIQCNISENTVKFHLKNIYKKLNVHNRVEAVYKINQNN